MSLSVKVAGIVKAYAGRDVLKAVSCDFPDGKISVILGPNGSGKTTLLRIISRLDRQDSGTVVYLAGGTPQEPGLSFMRRMTLVAQDPVLFNTTVYNNVSFGLKLRGLPPGEIKRRVGEALEMVKIPHLMNASARTLSGGEAQRAALARAFAIRPELLMLDEPSANLDPEGAALMETLVRDINEEFGTTVILVTHNLFQARRLADEVYLLYGGGLVESGPRESFFKNPEKELTRDFLSGEVIF